MVARPLLVLFTSIGGVLSLRLLDGVGKGLKDPAKDVLVAGSSKKKCPEEVLAWPECLIHWALLWGR